MVGERWAPVLAVHRTAAAAGADANAYADAGDDAALDAYMAVLAHRSARCDPGNDCPIRGESNRPGRLLQMEQNRKNTWQG